MQSAAARPPLQHSRLAELDWLRIAAFGLLILYHVGMFYVSWDWHVKSPRASAALEPWMLLLNPWRLSLLFVVSGAATAVMVQRAAGAPLAGRRSVRLLLPLVFGMAVIVPPQPFLEVVEKLRYAGSYPDFLTLYFTGFQGFCPGGKCLALPTWNHLWFVVYLWLYTVLLLGLLRVAGGGWARAAAWRRVTSGARLLWVPMLLFMLLRQQLRWRFPETHDLVHDLYAHLLYGSMFGLGFALFGERGDPHRAWEAAVRLRWWALGLALGVYAGVQVFNGTPASGANLPEATLMLLRACTAVQQWAPIVAALGFARLHLAGRDGLARRWLTEAVFPFYIVHQTVIVLLAHWLARRGWPLALEAAALVLLTAGACLATYALVRRSRWLRPLFGMAG